MSSPAAKARARTAERPAPPVPVPPPVPPPSISTAAGVGMRETTAAPNRYPHRISADLSPADYQRLHRLAFESGLAKTELIRRALALVTDEQLLG